MPGDHTTTGLAVILIENTEKGTKRGVGIMTVAGPTEIRTDISKSTQPLSELIGHVSVGQARVVVEKNGLLVATIISSQEYMRFLLAEEERAQRFAVLHRISDAVADIPVEEIEAELARTIAETRAQRRSENTPAT